MAASLGYALALQGRLTEGRALLGEAISAHSRAGGVRGLAYRVAWLSEVCRLAGRGAEAWQHARQALDNSQNVWSTRNYYRLASSARHSASTRAPATRSSGRAFSALGAREEVRARGGGWRGGLGACSQGGGTQRLCILPIIPDTQAVLSSSYSATAQEPRGDAAEKMCFILPIRESLQQ